MSFSEDIKKIRRKAFLTQEDFAREIGGLFCNSQSLGNWKGKAKPKDHETDR